MSSTAKADTGLPLVNRLYPAMTFQVYAPTSPAVSACVGIRRRGKKARELVEFNDWDVQIEYPDGRLVKVEYWEAASGSDDM